jgi:hypothetical protein
MPHELVAILIMARVIRLQLGARVFSRANGVRVVLCMVPCARKLEIRAARSPLCGVSILLYNGENETKTVERLATKIMFVCSAFCSVLQSVLQIL